MLNRLCFLLSLCLTLGQHAVHATHIIGTDLRYECLGPGTCTYRVYNYVYFDCSGLATQPSLPISANPLSPPSLGSTVYVTTPNGNCTVPNPTPVVQSYTEITPVCPGPGGISQSFCDTPSTNLVNGIAEAVYTYDFSLCGYNCSEFDVHYWMCCRNGSINSLDQPSTNALYVGPLRINTASSTCNSSPIFSSLATGSTIPRAYICAGQSSVLDFSGVDPDGDSLTYTLVDCQEQSGNQNGPISVVTYNTAGGFGGTTPLGPDWQASLDAKTGLLTLTPNPLGPTLTAVICVEVREFRNGALINQTVRDLQVEALPCGGNAAPQADSVVALSGGSSNGADTLFTSPGAMLSFYSKWSDPNPGDLLFLASVPGNALPGATVSTGNAGDSIVISWGVPSNVAGQSFTLPLQVTDNGCLYPLSSVQEVVILASEIGLSAQITDSDCNTQNGSIDLTVLGGTPPFTFAWNNSSTSEDLSSLGGGWYSVTVMDASGKVAVDSFFINQGDISLHASIVPPTCDQPDGGISLTPSGGTPPYTYQWNTGTTASSLAGLGIGGYSVVVTDSSGCFAQEIFELTRDDSCRSTLSGVAYFDANGNCVQDPGELGLPGLYVDLTPGGAMLTDSLGAYAFDVLVGTYQIDLNLPPQYLDSCLAGGGYSISLGSNLQDRDTLDFAIALPLTQNLSVFQQHSAALVPGDTVMYGLYGQNLGNQALSATLSWQYDPSQLEVVATTPTSATVGSGVVTFAATTLLPGQTVQPQVMVRVITSLQIGDSILTAAYIDPVANDATPADNVDSLLSPVLASYDPNDKQVSPVGIRAPGYVLAQDSIRTYTVRFQNTGTYPAQVVEIRDTIDSQLDITSLRVLGASHSYSTEIQADSVVVFTFQDINLPDSASDPVNSIGFISFRLTHQPSLPLGAELTNRAAIYFDYNPPIITNQVINTIFTYPELALEVNIPLCENDSFTASMPTPTVAPYLFEDDQGLSQSTNNPGLALQATSLSSGWYQLRVTDAFGFQAVDSVLLDLNALPTAGFTVTQLPQGDSIVLTLTDQATEADSYSWTVSGPDGTLSSETANPGFTLGQAGSYQITQIVRNRCGSDTSIASVMVGATSLAAAPFAGLSVHPNPFTQQTLIQWGQAQNVTFTLSDLRGKTLRRSYHRNTQTLRIARAGLAPGVYLFTLQVGGARQVGKLIVR